LTVYVIVLMMHDHTDIKCYQHVSVSVSTIIRVPYKNIRNQKICQNIQADLTLLRSMSRTVYTVTDYQLIYY